MTREEHIYEASKAYSEYEYNQTDYENGFINGAKWADRNPNLREEPNLESLWHDASEKPIEYPILCKDKLGNIWIEYSLNNYVEGWAECVEFNDIIRWAYNSDLLPKGSKEQKKPNQSI